LLKSENHGIVRTLFYVKSVRHFYRNVESVSQSIWPERKKHLGNVFAATTTRRGLQFLLPLKSNVTNVSVH